MRDAVERDLIVEPDDDVFDDDGVLRTGWWIGHGVLQDRDDRRGHLSRWWRAVRIAGHEAGPRSITGPSQTRGRSLQRGCHTARSSRATSLRVAGGRILARVITDGPSSARAAGCAIRMTLGPGISRRRAGRGFAIATRTARPIRDSAVLGRIRALAIPPAWTDVWICPDPVGHLQATGRDARGRKQYRYHARWRAGRDESKFERLIDFAPGPAHASGDAATRTWLARACPARRSSPRSCGCSRRRSSGSATTNTRSSIGRSA